MAEIKWAVLGTGVIANEVAAALAKAGRNIYAVGQPHALESCCVC